MSAASGERVSLGSLDPVTPPVRAADADLHYAYAGTERMLKTAVGDDDVERHTLYIFPSLEVRGAEWNGTVGDYALDPTGVSVRLHAGPVVGRVIHAEQDLPSLSSGAQHLFLQFADHLGSTTFTIDHESGELVEFTTYQAYGGTESDYRPGRWASFREPYKFGGKEEDIEVGLMYFGARYYSPYAAIWLSPDPVTIHELGSDHNPYAYVGGSPIMNVDPDGRELCTLAVLGIIAAVSAIVAATTSVTVQAVQNGGIDEVNWGLSGVAGAALAGAVSGFVGGAAGLGAGAVAGAGLAGASAAGATFGAAVIGGAVGGAVGGAAGYLTSAGVAGSVGGRRFRGKAFGKSVGLGALSGAVSGAASGGISWGGEQTLTSGLVGSLAGAGTGYGVGAAIDGRFSALDMVVSLGGSVAGVLANHGAMAVSGGKRADSVATLDDVDFSGLAQGGSSGPGLIDNPGALANGKLGALRRIVSVGAKGRSQVVGYLRNHWDKATFGTVEASIRYHVAKHGKGWSPLEYTNTAIRAFADPNAVRSAASTKTGKAAIKVQGQHGNGLFTPNGKVIWFHPAVGRSALGAVGLMLFDFADITRDGIIDGYDVFEWVNPGFTPMTQSPDDCPGCA